MKKNLSVLFLFAIFCLTFSSCKKPAEQTLGVTAGMSAKVNGVLKTNSGPTVATIYQDLHSIQIIGQFSANEGISLGLNDIKVGTYDASGDAVIAVYMASTTNTSEHYMGVSGKVTITSITSTTVAGTFEFVAENGSGVKRTISEGSFNTTVIRI